MNTYFDALIESLHQAAEYNKNDVSKPAAILWTDKDSQWISLTEKIRSRLPEFLIFGDYDPKTKTGPGIWIRCMIARTLDSANWAEGAVPIIYIPGVSRQELRAVEDCPEHLKPIVELQYRGVFWTQKNAKDWTILSFLQSKDGGLGLDVAHDTNTKEAAKKALLQLADTPISKLKGRRLEAEDFYALIQPDPIRDILLWMDNPKGMESSWGKTSFDTFVKRCKEKYGFNPTKDGELAAAELMGKQEGDCKNVWDRFEEAPQNYPNIPDLLRRAKPGLFGNESSWPQDNENLENELRNNLLDFAKLNPAEAAKKVILLESNHKKRRDWVWAKLGQAPLAFAVEKLSQLALQTSKPLPSSSLDSMIDAYTESGYKADILALEALAFCSELEPRNLGAVSCAVRILYQSYLAENARHFQELVNKKNLKDIKKVDLEVLEGECILFADGLRYDIAQKLSKMLSINGMDVHSTWTVSPMPTVTATAKPAVSPIQKELSDKSESDEFLPSLKDEKKQLTSELFRKKIVDLGFDILEGQELGEPDKKAWTEIGEIDSYGHKYGLKLALHLDSEIKSIAHRVLSLLKHGYQKVILVTDHGWLLLPGDLPKTDLPHYLARTRWSRCAKLKDNIAVDFPTHPWHFNKNIQVVSPRGIDVFYAGNEYAHGGLSLQECIVPILTVKSSYKPLKVELDSIKWVGLRCRIELSGEFGGCKVEIRTKPADPSTSLAVQNDIPKDGKVALLVENDELIDHPAAIVILDSQDRIVIKKPVIIGEK